MKHLVIPTDLKAARPIESEVLELARSQGYSDEAAFAIKLALEEALTNAMKHGNRSDASKSVTVEYEVGPKRTVIEVTDEGKGFEPHAVPDPTADENLECPTGRGIMLMRAYMDEVTYSRGGRTVRLVKHNS